VDRNGNFESPVRLGHRRICSHATALVPERGEGVHCGGPGGEFDTHTITTITGCRLVARADNCTHPPAAGFLGRSTDLAGTAIRIGAVCRHRIPSHGDRKWVGYHYGSGESNDADDQLSAVLL
jgi:hypothetical protein